MVDTRQLQSGHNIPQAVLASAERYPDAPALHDWQDNAWHVWTYGELSCAIRETAQGLIKLGIEPDDRVALLGPNSPEWGIAYLGILAAGAIAVPLDRMLASPEWLEYIKAAEPVAVIAAATEGNALKPELIHASSVRQYIALTGAASSPDLTLAQVRALADDSTAAVPLNRQPDDLAAILFTSGTTGSSKGVMLSHRNIVHDALAMLQVFNTVGPADRFLSILPMSHCYECTGGFLLPLLAGSQIFYGRGLTAHELLGDMQTSNATFLLAVPLIYEKLLGGMVRGLKKKGGVGAIIVRALWGISRSGRLLWGHRLGKVTLGALRAKCGLSHVRCLVSGGAPLPAEIGNALEAVGIKFIQGYGLTETAPVATLNRFADSIPSSVGKPLPGVEVKIHEPDPEGKGEIWIKGPIVTPGYWRDQASTESVIENGWFKTGDLGRFGPDGHLFITGRTKHLIITPGGKNISPEEIEAVVARSPFIAESIVYGAPAKDGAGEVIQALIHPDFEYVEEWQKASGETCDLKQLLRRELDRTCAALAGYKRIVSFKIAEEPFQKTSSKKIKRHLHADGKCANSSD